jgi:hypothetical protein
MLTEVIIPMSVTEEHANSSWNLPSINTVSAVNGKNLLTEFDTTPTNEEWTLISLVRISAKLTVRPKSVIFFRKRCCDSNGMLPVTEFSCASSATS